ncbi:proton channel OtopLc-like [Argopecten irradians]|uniref:proton channel OtopLc-like n=1 Tax=Argopecten irradians TaxID=31199 RepID=UPI00371D64CD
MTEPNINAQSSSYLQKIINSDFDMGSINTEAMKMDSATDTQKEKSGPKIENTTSAFTAVNGKGAPNMDNEASAFKVVSGNGYKKNNKGVPKMKSVSNGKFQEKDKQAQGIVLKPESTETYIPATPASVSSEDMFRDIKSIDSDDVKSTIVPKSPSFGRPYHIKTNGSLNSPSDNETDKASLNGDMKTKPEHMKMDTLPKQNSNHKLQRRHSEMDGINKESYMIGNQYKVLSGTASLERNIHLQHENVPTAVDERRLSGWLTIGHSYKRRHGEGLDKTKRTTWGGKYASKQRESLKVLNELDNAYNYSSDSSGDHYYDNKKGLSSFSKVISGNTADDTIGVDDGDADDVFVSQTNTDDVRKCEESLQEYLSICMSGIYGIFLVATGIIVPMAETFADPVKMPFVFEAFYLYLYVAGILFIVYIYAFMMRKKHMGMRDIAKALSRRLSSSKAPSTSVSDQPKEEHPFSYQSVNYPYFTGSFYLRLGAVMFGVGSMVDSGLHFGQHLQAFDGNSMCNKPIEAAKPFGHLVFTFIQLYFVFLNAKLCVHTNKTVARFGMIHLCCTNVCVWVQSLVMETLSVLHNWNQNKKDDISPRTKVQSSNQSDIYESTSMDNSNYSNHVTVPEATCYWDDMMSRVVQSTGPYLYSCTIEYSIICTGILCVMWINVGTDRNSKCQTMTTGNDEISPQDDDTISLNRSSHKISIDCTNSSRGLFIGILVSVCAIITTVAFYVMINLKAFQESAVVLMLLSEMSMYILTSIASFLAAERMHKLRHYSEFRFGLEESLLLASFTGLLLFGVFNIIPDVFYTDKAIGVLNVMTNLLMILQASIQTVLLLATRKLRAGNKVQEKAKYGRQFITFLILCNFALWTLETFQSREPEHNFIQVNLYGIEAWTLFSHIVVPLAIFFRFHSFVYLLSIWKNAWKMKIEAVKE